MAASTAAAGLATRVHNLCPSTSSHSDGAISRRSSAISCALPNVGICPSEGPLSNLFSSSQSQICSSASRLFSLKRATRKVSLRVRAVVGEELDQITAYGGEDEFQQTTTPGVKLYVGNLPWKVDSESLAEVFESVGKVDLVEVVYDRMSGKSRGFGFVTMGSVEEAQRAIDTLNGTEMDGRSLRVNFPQAGSGDRGTRGADAGARRAPRADNPNKLYVGNLSWGMDDFGLEDLFSEFGKVIEAKVVSDRDTGRSRGFGFVTFETEAEVGQAIQGLNGVDVDGRAIRVNLASDKPVRTGGYSGGGGGRGGGGGGYGGGRRDDGYGGRDDSY